mmetsp:Transcript_10313/g.21657  ORF Transcript_10313/g.21657 Transcript_10313/m.21657 type:complete len:198 (-) Transcript_10313:437-1030(-)
MKQSNNTNKHSTMHQPLFRFRLLAVMVLVVAVATTTTNGLFCSAFATTTSSRPLSVSLLSLGHTHRDSFFLQRSSRVSSQLRLKSDGLTPEERDAKIEKATKAMTAFTNSYLKNTDTKLCSEKSIPAVVIKGLAEHKVDLGAPLCPCRVFVLFNVRIDDSTENNRRRSEKIKRGGKIGKLTDPSSGVALLISGLVLY